MNKMPKFRCWLLAYPRMYEVLEMRFHNQIPNHCYETEPSVTVKPDPTGCMEHFAISKVIIMQDTGFKDIDDKPIYEGDIVETCAVWMHDNDVNAIIFNAEFKSEIGLISNYRGDWTIIKRLEYCIYMPSNIRRLSDSPGCLSTYVRIIGNQWENPGLLEKYYSDKEPEPVEDIRAIRKQLDDICKGKLE